MGDAPPGAGGDFMSRTRVYLEDLKLDPAQRETIQTLMAATRDQLDQLGDALQASDREARAKAVVDFLRNRKVEQERITWKGYGETKPLMPNNSEANRTLNRRVEFRVTGK